MRPVPASLTARTSRGRSAGGRTGSTPRRPRRGKGTLGQDSGAARTRRGTPRTAVQGCSRFVALAPFVAFMALFFAYPLFEVVRLALSHSHINGTKLTLTFAGTANIARAFGDAIFGVAVRNNVLFIVGSTALTTLGGVWLALIASRRQGWATVLQRVLLWPSIIAPVAVSVIWWMLMSPQFGLVNDILRGLGTRGQGWLGSPHTALAVLIVVDTWHWMPICFVLAFAGIQAIDAQLLEAAQVDGASEWAATRFVKLPLLLPTIGAIVAIRVLMGSKVFDELYLLTGGGPGHATTVLSLYIQNVFFTQSQLGYGAALALVVAIGLLCCWLATLGIRFTQRKMRRSSLVAADA